MIVYVCVAHRVQQIETPLVTKCGLKVLAVYIWTALHWPGGSKRAGSAVAQSMQAACGT